VSFTPKYAKGATPLTRDELAGLIPNYITTQGELNTLERTNILDGLKWANKKAGANILTVDFTHDLHRRMFDQVWKWAGSPRNSDKNIGIPWTQISIALPTLLRNVETWIQGNVYPRDEIGARFHHRLVEIHVFPNGNGRHARIMTDLLLEKNGQTPFSWGASQGALLLEEEGDARSEYIAALQEADQKKFRKLIQFVRT
jgi:Fic-DOC domain mobile mystery protein B